MQKPLHSHLGILVAVGILKHLHLYAFDELQCTQSIVLILFIFLAKYASTCPELFLWAFHIKRCKSFMS